MVDTLLANINAVAELPTSYGRENTDSISFTNDIVIMSMDAVDKDDLYRIRRNPQKLNQRPYGAALWNLDGLGEF